MTCKNCGTENEVGAKFCRGCGTLLIEETNNPVNNNLTQTVEQPMNYNQPVNNFQQPVTFNQTFNNVQTIDDKNKSDNKKLFIIIAAIVGILILIAIIVALSGNKEEVKTTTSSESNNKISTDYYSYKTDNLYKINKDGKVGYIDYNGNVVIEPKYQSGSDFYGDYAIVGDTEGNSLGVSLIDRQGNVKLKGSSKYAIKYLNTGYLVENSVYDMNLNKVTADSIKASCINDECAYLEWKDETNNKEGIMKTDGTITYQEDAYESLFGVYMKEVNPNIKERYCNVSGTNTYKVVNCEDGTVIYDGKDTDIIIEDYNNIFKIKSRSSRQIFKTIYAQNNKIAAESNSEDVTLYYSDKGYLVITDKSSGKNVETYLTNNGLTNEKPKDNLEDRELYDGYKVFKSSDKYGLTKDGKEVIPAQYKDVKLFNKEVNDYTKKIGREYAILQDAGDYSTLSTKYYLYNITDKKIQAEFVGYYPYSYDKYIDSSIMAYEEDGKYILYSILTGRSLSIDGKTRTSSNNDYIKLEDSTAEYIYNSEMKLIYTIDK